MILQYTDNNIPKRFSNLFTVGIETILIVPIDYVELVIRILTERRYEYKAIARQKIGDFVFGIQYQRGG